MGKKHTYNTTIDTDLAMEIRILAAQLDKRQNNLIEEAIQDLIKKYKNDNSKESQLDFLVSKIIQKNSHFFLSIFCQYKYPNISNGNSPYV